MKVSNIIAFLASQKIKSVGKSHGLNAEEIEQYYISVYGEIFKEQGVNALKRILINNKYK